MDVPGDLSRAISQGVRILGWQENLLDEEMPPEWMWVFEDELEIWFEEVGRNRKIDFSSEGSDDYVDNEFAERFR